MCHMVINSVTFPLDTLAEICERYGAARLSLFGSILRDDFNPASDVDMLVEFRPDRTPTLFSIAAMEADLSELLGRKVDLRTPRELSRFFRDKVVAQARLLHAA